MKWIEDFRERHLLPRRYGKAEANDIILKPQEGGS